MNESPPSELQRDLERMLEEGIGANVTFGVGGREFSAHRSLLAVRSPVFRAQFFGAMAEKDTSHVKIVDMEPIIFEMMLRYIYTKSLPSCNNDEGGLDNAPVLQHLLFAADRYGLNRLKLVCEGELCKRMDMDTVFSMLALAYQHQCKRLWDACIGFLSAPKVLLWKRSRIRRMIPAYASSNGLR